MLFTAGLPAYAYTAAELQNQADLLREKGESLKAIDIYNQVIVRHQENKDYANMIGALTGRLLSWKHLFDKTEDEVYAAFVKKDAEVMLEMAKKHQLLDRIYLICFLNGLSDVLLKDYPAAEKEFSQAVELYPNDNPEKGNWMAHLGEAVYRNGKKEEGQILILQGIQIIEEKSSQIDPVLFNVWISGAYFRLAKLLKPDNLKDSQIFLSKAKNHGAGHDL